MPVINQRTCIDKNLLSALKLPAAGANAVTASVDLNTDTPGRIDEVELRLFIDALPNLADGKKVTITLQESSDNSAFTTAADLPTYSTVGAGNTGSPAFQVQVKFPIYLKRYIRLRADVDAAAGDNTAASFGLVPVF